MDKINWTLLWTIFTALIAVLGVLAKVLVTLTKWETQLANKIEQNRIDINNGLKAVRKENKQKDYYINVQIDTIAKYLEDTTDYRHPSIGRFDNNE